LLDVDAISVKTIYDNQMDETDLAAQRQLFFQKQLMGMRQTGGTSARKLIGKKVLAGAEDTSEQRSL
jgi:hypothetical protein